MWYYSQLFNIPLPLILDSNRDIEPNALQIGQTVRIPGFYVNFYIIQPGDTFWGISKQLGINFDVIQLLNPTINPYHLQLGQRINIPFRVQNPIVQGRRAYGYRALYM